ncbi:Cytochrome b5 [Metarhizium album ARSEF 1941]|uniref:Cytochrome b5 n=1 Tax=Metarhizium album (strain ARSEF 1941) TaxID=1081103 RepID=A0A0B2WSP5_METAS|nr:Cytochrome b5 [Metarhizium album ARSEF 1941]KHN95975.1 Cytochrome b5 [Metarhizium album ARSEF 1941]
MGLLAISLLVTSVVYVIIRPPNWLAHRLLRIRGFGGAIAVSPTRQKRTPDDTAPRTQGHGLCTEKSLSSVDSRAREPSPPDPKPLKDAAAVPPPPPPPLIHALTPTDNEPEGSTTPKAAAATPSSPVPGFSLSSEPPAVSPPAGTHRARGPVPNRGAAGLSVPGAGLAPPPTHSTKPQKPSRKVMLDPGRSPLDWARISGPDADLRGVEPSTPYLRVTPSLLKKQTGRKGKDAWMALNGKVYNVTPYAKFHPGGVEELMKGAARDGTKLFGEIHPWVNYETMLAACLVGLLVEEPEAGSQGSEMDEMD